MLSPSLREVKESQVIMKKVGKALGFLFPTLRLVNQTFDSGNKYDMSENILADKNNYTGKLVPGSVRTVLNAMEEL
jgi:hypothetical protein